MSNPLSPDSNQNLLPSTSFSALNWEPKEPNPAVILQSDLLIGHINQNPNITALTPNPSDSLLLAQIQGSIATIDPNITLPNDNSFDGLTGEAMDIVKEQLTQFAKVPNFVEKMNLAFGESWDTQAANVLTQDWLNGNFSLIPPVKFVSSAEIGGANGAFAAATDTIYLSRELLARNSANPAAVADVLLHEIGHSVDARLNVADSPGDEGAIFGAVVQGKVLSEGELQGLRGESDSGTFIFNGQAISIEKAFDWGNNWGVQSWNRNGNSKSWEPLWNGKAKDFGSATRSDGKKGFAKDWGNGSPVAGVNQDDFYLRFWTQADFQQGQTYNFNVKADDKYALLAFPVGANNKNQIEWIGGDQLKGDAFEGKTIQFTPKNSGKYWVLADYREIANTAYFDLSWEQTSSVPAGFTSVKSAKGVNLYESADKSDYVQAVDLSQGASIELLTGQQIGNTSEIPPYYEKPAYGGISPTFERQSLGDAWGQFKSRYSNAFSINNGALFQDKPDQSAPAGLSYPLRTGNMGNPDLPGPVSAIVFDGFEAKTVNIDKQLKLNIWNNSASISAFDPNNPYSLFQTTAAPKQIVGLTGDANKDGAGNSSRPRTYIGVQDRDSNGTNETVLILNSTGATEGKAAQILKDFGANQVMMLDGGGSTQMSAQGQSYIFSERKIPQTIGVVSG